MKMKMLLARAPFTVTSVLVALVMPSTGLPNEGPDTVVGNKAVAYTGPGFSSTRLPRALDATTPEGRATQEETRERNGAPNAEESAPPAETVLTGNGSSTTRIPVMDALRARITGGAIFFNQSKLVHNEADGTARYESPQFSMASTYVAFEAQPRLWPMVEQEKRESHRRVYVEGITNVRLTTIGVAGNGGNSGISAADASVLNSAKSAQVELGVLASINARRFNVGGTRFHWGFGPVYRTVLQTVTDAQRNRRVWNTEDDLYGAHTYGARVTLYSRPTVPPSNRVGRRQRIWTLRWGGSRTSNGCRGAMTPPGNVCRIPGPAWRPAYRRRRSSRRRMNTDCRLRPECS